MSFLSEMLFAVVLDYYFLIVLPFSFSTIIWYALAQQKGSFVQ